MSMGDDDQMPIDWPQHRMWTVGEDRYTVRLQLPPLPIEGPPEPLKVFLEFDAGMVEETIERLLEVRRQMLPPIC